MGEDALACKVVQPYLVAMTSSSTLTVTAKGQVTFRRGVLEHLGAAPGDRLEVVLLPGGRAEVRAAPRGDLDAFIGSLAREDQTPVSIEEMTRAAASGWAGER